MCHECLAPATSHTSYHFFFRDINYLVKKVAAIKSLYVYRVAGSVAKQPVNDVKLHQIIVFLYEFAAGDLYYVKKNAKENYIVDLIHTLDAIKLIIL